MKENEMCDKKKNLIIQLNVVLRPQLLAVVLCNQAKLLNAPTSNKEQSRVARSGLQPCCNKAC